ncbi:MAG TPA: hypothetical protein VIJ93_03050 [bacterium]
MPEESKKEIAAVQVTFASRFQAFVDFQSSEPDDLSKERDVIQLFSLTLVKVLFLLGENKQALLLLQYIQQAMGDTVTPQGLKRPTITGPEQKLLETAPEIPERRMALKLIQEEEGRLAELSLPVGDEGHFYPATVIFYLQYLLKKLSDPSLFFLMLVLGGVMEYYEKIGKTYDLKALTNAPAFGFSTAVKYIEEERRRSQESPGPSSLS